MPFPPKDKCKNSSNSSIAVVIANYNLNECFTMQKARLLNSCKP